VKQKFKVGNNTSVKGKEKIFLEPVEKEKKGRQYHREMSY